MKQMRRCEHLCVGMCTKGEYYVYDSIEVCESDNAHVPEEQEIVWEFQEPDNSKRKLCIAATGMSTCYGMWGVGGSIKGRKRNVHPIRRTADENRSIWTPWIQIQAKMYCTHSNGHL